MSLELLAHLDLSAASGLVHRAGFLYVVADDDLALVRTDLMGAHSVRLPLTNAPKTTHLPKDKKPDSSPIQMIRKRAPLFRMAWVAGPSTPIRMNDTSLSMRWLLLSAVMLVGCNRVCTRPEALTGLDGGAFTCVQNTDCPRPSSVLVCGQNEDQLRDCIACTDNRCVRYRPVACP